MRIAYWIVTGLMALLMAASGVPDILMIPEALAVFRHLGYPDYLLPFIGVAKILGAIAVVQPFFPYLKEWAYAGLMIDVIGALYSHISVGDPPSGWAPPLVAILLVGASYALYRITLAENRTRHLRDT